MLKTTRRTPLSAPVPPAHCMGTSLIVRTIKVSSARRWLPRCPARSRTFCCWIAAQTLSAARNAERLRHHGQRLRREGHGPHRPQSRALVNNGAEETKGTPIYREAHQLLKANPGIHFAGNIEPRYIMDGEVDVVVVCDGFTSATWSSS